MATTLRTDVIAPEVLLEAVRGEFQGLQALLGTDAAIVRAGLPDTLRGGDVVKIPYFGTLGDFEDVGENIALTPSKLTMTADTANVIHSGKAFEITEWASLAASYAEPYAEAARQIKLGWQRRIDSALITVAKATTLATTIATTITYDAIVDGLMLFGDEQDAISLIAMNSKVYGDAHKVKTADGLPLLVHPNKGGIPTILGVPVKVSDKLTPSGTDYPTLFVKRSALGFWYRISQGGVQEDRDILVDSKVASLHLYHASTLYKHRDNNSRAPVAKLITK